MHRVLQCRPDLCGEAVVDVCCARRELVPQQGQRHAPRRLQHTVTVTVTVTVTATVTVTVTMQTAGGTWRGDLVQGRARREAAHCIQESLHCTALHCTII
jgi:hypothetical protein